MNRQKRKIVPCSHLGCTVKRANYRSLTGKKVCSKHIRDSEAYPLILRASRKLVEEFHGCEFGRYEDACVARERGEGEDYPTFVGCEILDRRKEGIEIRDEVELREIRWAIGSGTIGLESWGMYRAAILLCQQIDAIADTLGIVWESHEQGYPECPEFPVGHKGLW